MYEIHCTCVHFFPFLTTFIKADFSFLRCSVVFYEAVSFLKIGTFFGPLSFFASEKVKINYSDQQAFLLTSESWFIFFSLGMYLLLLALLVLSF